MSLKCLTEAHRYSSAGVGGLCVGIFSSLQGGLCAWGFVCLANVLKIAWGSVEKVMGCVKLEQCVQIG